MENLNEDAELFYSNKDMKRQIRKIVRDITIHKFDPELIVAPIRGGLIVGVYLSHYYNVDLICLSMDPYKKPKYNISLHAMADALRNNKNVLVVDDICDKGNTLRNICDTISDMCPEVKSLKQNLHTAVLIHNDAEDLFVPDYVGDVINKYENPSWVVFNWEAWW